MAEKISCLPCEVRELCLPQGLSARETKRLDGLVKHGLRIARNGYLYRAGTGFHSLFAIRSGFLRSSVPRAGGYDQVTGFHMKGDIVGVGGMSNNVYAFNMTALEDSDICQIPFSELEGLALKIPRLQRNICRLMSRYIARDYEVMALLRGTRAETRIAGFLRNFSRRLALRGASPTRLRLPMMRKDIASYLGMSQSALSRGIARLEREGLIRVQGRSVEIKDLSRLEALLRRPR